jgi:hypothetical protein
LYIRRRNMQRVNDLNARPDRSPATDLDTGLSTPKLINIKELSKLISVPIGTLYNWCYLHRIPFIKAGRSLRFDPLEVVASMPHSDTIRAAVNGRRS